MAASRARSAATLAKPPPRPIFSRIMGEGPAFCLGLTMKASLTSAAAIEKAMISPPSVFDHPREVVSLDLPTAQKIEILLRWQFDARALQRAADENMFGGNPPMLDEINAALTAVDPSGNHADPFRRAAQKV